MGVNANFQADFTTFNNAVDMAIVKLADFGKGAEEVEVKLNNMVDKWSGRALIQQASELVVAINKVGGATALTTTEQTKLNNILTEAIAKYKVLGEAVPPEIQKLADATKDAAQATKDASQHSRTLGEGLTSVATTAAAAFSVQAVVSYVGKLVDGASALNNLSIQTHINVEDLQVLAAATSSYGVTSDELGRALYQLQSRIAGGDQSVTTAYARMGISLDDLKGKNATELFEMTERALGRLEGGIRDAAAADLYGGKLGASMSAFATGSDEAIAKAKQLNYITSTESVKAMAEYGDAIARAKTSIDAFATEGLGKLAQGFNVLNEASAKGASTWQIFKAGYLDWFGAQTGLIGSTDHLATLLDHLNVEQEKNAASARDQAKANGEVVVALDAQGQAAQFMATMQKNAVVPLLDYQRQYLEQLTAMGQLTAQNAAGIGVSVAQFEKYKKGLDDAKAAHEALTKAIADHDAIVMDTYNKQIKTLDSVTQATLKAYSFEGQIGQLNALAAAEETLARAVYQQLDSEKLRMKVIEDLTAKRAAITQQQMALEAKHAGVVNQQVVDELTARSKVMEAYGQQADGTLKIENAQTKLTVAMDALHAKKQEGVSQYYQEQALMDQFLKDQDAEVAAINRATDAHDRETAAIKRKGDARDSFSLAGASSVPDKFAGWSQERLRLAGYIDLLGKVTAAGEAAGLGDSGGPIRPSGRASGGPVESGTPYMVGERGPELFVPSSHGAIVPNGGGGGVTINLHGAVLGTPQQIARTVGGAMVDLLRAQGTRLPAGGVS